MMPVSEGVLLGLLSMFGWGIADFFVAKATQETNVLKTLFWSQTLSAVILGSVASLFFGVPEISLFNIGIMLSIGFLMTVAYMAFYRGIKIGKLSLVSPIAAAWVVITVALSIIFLGQSLTLLQLGGVSLIISGTILCSFKWHDLVDLNWRNYEKGIAFALVALLGWGLAFTLLDIAVNQIGWLVSIFILKALVAFYLGFYGKVRSRNFHLPEGKRLDVILIGIFEALAFALFGFGITLDQTALVAPIAAAFPVVAVILAYLFLDERMDTNQWMGIALIMPALVVLSL